jgi:hypothetical protein
MLATLGTQHEDKYMLDNTEGEMKKDNPDLNFYSKTYN